MNIVLTGATSLSNKGTAATVISTIVMLRRAFPRSNISLELYFPSRQKRIIDLGREYNVEVTAPLIQSPDLRKLSKYKTANAIVDLSAEAFVRYYDDSLRSLATRFILHLIPLLVALAMRKPIVFLAQTLGPFGPFRLIMVHLLNKAKLVTLRDSVSLENLERVGVDTSRIWLTADPAFLIDVAPKSRIERILRKEGVADVGKRRIIGLCAAKVTGKVLAASVYEKIIQAFAGAANDLIEKDNALVMFIPHSSGKVREENDDVRVGMEILGRIKQKERFVVIKGDYSPQELKGIIGTLDCLVSLRMHPVIFASSLGIPSVIVAFNPKAYGLMKMLELENNVVHIDDIEGETLASSVRICLLKGKLMQARLKRILPVVRESASMNFKLLEQILNEN